MNKVAQFEKISYEQFLKDLNMPNDELAASVYTLLKTPERSTKGSAGYDFHLPFGISLSPGSEIKIPTGMRCKIDDGWVLKIYPRSSIGFKYLTQLANTVGVIDADYYNADNEGHIWIKLVNNGKNVLNLDADDKFAQGIFVPFGITYDDEVETERTGGLGSTGK